MLRVTLCLTVLLSSCGLSMDLFAAEAPVTAFPANSGVVVRIDDLDATMKKVKDLAAAIEPDENKRQMVTNQLDFAGAMTGTIIDNPAKAGVKPETDWWIAAIAKGGSEQPPAVIIAVQPEDVQTVKDAVGDAYTFIEYDNWLLYTKDADAAEAVRACIAGDAPNIEAAADETTKSIFMKSDAAVFVHIKELVKTYDDELQMARQQADQALSEAENFSPEVEGMNMKAVFGMYRDMFSGLLTALEESNSCTIGMTVSAEGIHFDEYLNVQPETATSRFLASHPTSAMQILNRLPAEQPVYFGFNGDMQALSKWGVEFAKSMFEDEADDAEQWDKALEQMGKLELGSYAASMGLGDLETGLLRSAAISEVKNAKQTKEIYAEMFQMFGSIQNPVVKQTMEYEPDAETVAGQSVDKLTVKQEFDTEIDPTGLQKEMMKKMYGPGGAVTRIVYLENYVVQTMGGGTEALEGLLKTVNSPASDPAVAATREELAKEANLIALVDLAGLGVRGVYLAAEANMLDPAQIPPLEFDRSYLGYSVAVSAEGVDVDAHLPAEQIKGLYQIGMNIYLMFNAQ